MNNKLKILDDIERQCKKQLTPGEMAEVIKVLDELRAHVQQTPAQQAANREAYERNKQAAHDAIHRAYNAAIKRAHDSVDSAE